MSNLTEQSVVFRDVAARAISDMFGVEGQPNPETEQNHSVITSKTFLVSIYYTGTVYGEYLMAMDETTAARIIGSESSRRFLGFPDKHSVSLQGSQGTRSLDRLWNHPEASLLDQRQEHTRRRHPIHHPAAIRP